MFEDTETYRLARFSTATEAEVAQRCLSDVGIPTSLIAVDGESVPEAGWGEAVFLVCRSDDRIQATVALERARII